MKVSTQFNMRLDPNFMEEMRMKAVKLGYYSFSDFVQTAMAEFNKEKKDANKTIQIGT